MVSKKSSLTALDKPVLAWSQNEGDKRAKLNR